jgi:hypothetical protein
MSEEKPPAISYATPPSLDARPQPAKPRRPWWKITLMVAAEVALIVTLIFVIWATLLPTLKGPSPDAVRQPAGRSGRGR